MYETPAGKACPRETPQEHSDEEASGPPAESEYLQRKSTLLINRAYSIEKSARIQKDSLNESENR
jgi:hypothetical protein